MNSTKVSEHDTSTDPFADSLEPQDERMARAKRIIARHADATTGRLNDAAVHNAVNDLVAEDPHLKARAEKGSASDAYNNGLQLLLDAGARSNPRA